MKAPKKIYIHPDIGGKEFLRPWLRRAANNESIEYTRTDAIIEKACEWIKRNSEMYIICEDHFYSGWLNEDFYEEFRKVMKKSE